MRQFKSRCFIKLKDWQVPEVVFISKKIGEDEQMIRPLYVFSFLVLLLVAILGFTIHIWNSPSQIQAIGSIGALIATITLVGLTFAYVRTNQENLALLREQWSHQRRVNLRFGVRKSPTATAQVWIANIGLSDVLISKITIMKVDEKPKTIFKNIIVRPGQKRFPEIPTELWQSPGLPNFDIQVQLTYESFGNPSETEGKAYNIATNLDKTKVFRVRRGVHGLWSVECPKCGRWDGMYVEVDGLMSFEEAERKRKRMRDEVGVGCPDHRSELMLTLEKVRNTNAKQIPDEEE